MDYGTADTPSSMPSCVSNHPFFYPPCILFDKNFLFNGKSIKQGKDRIKGINRKESKEKDAGNLMSLSEVRGFCFWVGVSG